MTTPNIRTCATSEVRQHKQVVYAEYDPTGQRIIFSFTPHYQTRDITEDLATAYAPSNNLPKPIETSGIKNGLYISYGQSKNTPSLQQLQDAAVHVANDLYNIRMIKQGQLNPENDTVECGYMKEAALKQYAEHAAEAAKIRDLA